jgi:hypothetical protein
MILLPEERVKRDFFIDEVLERHDEHRSETRKKNRSYDTFGNAWSHLVESKFDSIGIPRLSHPPYRPDTTPCACSLFGSLKMKLEGMFFDTPAAL